MRQPKWCLLSTLGFWLKMTLTSVRRFRSSLSRARARAVLLVFLSALGSAKQK